jgi:hypothetical protein
MKIGKRFIIDSKDHIKGPILDPSSLAKTEETQLKTSTDFKG